MYALEPFRTFFEVGDDLTGPKASKTSLRRRRRGRSIRFVFGLYTSSVAKRDRWTPLRRNKAIGCAGCRGVNALMGTGNRLSLTHIPVVLSVMSLSTLLLSPATQSLLVAEKTATAHQSVKMTRPSLEPIAVVGPCDLNISISRDRSPTASPAANSDIPTCTSPPKSPPSEPSSHPLSKCTSSPSRKRQPSRRQSSISYLPADSPRLWTPRTPQTGPDFLERSPSLAGKKEGHVRARSQVIPHRPPSEPVVLTLAERCVLSRLFFVTIK